MSLSKGPTIYFSVQITVQLLNHSKNKKAQKNLPWKDKLVTKKTALPSSQKFIGLPKT